MIFAKEYDDPIMGPGFHIHVQGELSHMRFKELVQRGTNLWPDAHPEIKEFADRVTVGHVQQKYHEQATDKHRRVPQQVNYVRYCHLCSCGHYTMHDDLAIPAQVMCAGCKKTEPFNDPKEGVIV